ncbi:MAG: winged helix-turn-helix domain-containing protein [Acidobacteria bacterium]|nr:winged helix-turn-helix domain-containing protein [Acidobacteriota bacterium]
MPKSSDTNKSSIAELRDLLDQAQATIFQLKQLLRTQGRYPHEEITLTPTQRKVVDILLQTDGISTKGHLYEALYASKQGHAPDPKILREIIRLIRKQLKPHGIEISSVTGKGYTISNADKDKLNTLIFKSEALNGNLYKGINLSRTQRKFVNLLLAENGVCTKEYLYDVLYTTKQNYKPDPKILREMLWAIRKQFEPFGIEIKTVFGVGYIMPCESKAKLIELIIR